MLRFRRCFPNTWSIRFENSKQIAGVWHIMKWELVASEKASAGKTFCCLIYLQLYIWLSYAWLYLHRTSPNFWTSPISSQHQWLQHFCVAILEEPFLAKFEINLSLVAVTESQWHNCCLIVAVLWPRKSLISWTWVSKPFVSLLQWSLRYQNLGVMRWCYK